MQRLEEYESDDEDDPDYCETQAFAPDLEEFTTPLDGPNGLDVFIVFKNVMEGRRVVRWTKCSAFEHDKVDLFKAMIADIDEANGTRLQNLITVCAQHEKAEESRRVEQAGGYSFDASAPIPAAFDFGKKQ